MGLYSGPERPVAVVPLLYDWEKGGRKKLTAKDIRRAQIFDSEFQKDTKDNRYYLAASLGKQHLPAVVIDYHTFKEQKGKAPILYTLTEDDHDNYMKDALEADERQG